MRRYFAGVAWREETQRTCSKGWAMMSSQNVCVLIRTLCPAQLRKWLSIRLLHLLVSVSSWRVDGLGHDDHHNDTHRSLLLLLLQFHHHSPCVACRHAEKPAFPHVEQPAFPSRLVVVSLVDMFDTQVDVEQLPTCCTFCPGRRPL